MQFLIMAWVIVTFPDEFHMRYHPHLTCSGNGQDSSGHYLETREEKPLIGPLDPLTGRNKTDYRSRIDQELANEGTTPHLRINVVYPVAVGSATLPPLRQIYFLAPMVQAIYPIQTAFQCQAF